MKKHATPRPPCNRKLTPLARRVGCLLTLFVNPLLGCSDNKDPSLEPVDACDQTAAIDPTLLIDDFEDGDESLPMVAGRNGSWWTAGDDTAGAHHEPSEGGAPILLPEARCDSRFALRFTGSGFQDWGALIGMSFVYAPDANGEWGTAAHDASDHEGVRFWARIGDTSAANASFSVQGRLQGEVPAACPEPEPSGDGCMDSFSVPLSELTARWKHYEVPFSGLEEHPPANLTLDQRALYSLWFSFPPATVFDFWVDDVSFY